MKAKGIREHETGPRSDAGKGCREMGGVKRPHALLDGSRGKTLLVPCVSCELIVHAVPGEPERVQRRHDQPKCPARDGLDLYGAVERNFRRPALKSSDPPVDISIGGRPAGALDAGQKSERSNISSEFACRLDHAVPGACLARPALQGSELRWARWRTVGAHASDPAPNGAVLLAPTLLYVPDEDWALDTNASPAFDAPADIAFFVFG